MARSGKAEKTLQPQVLGRPLESYEEVHHINGIKDDNRDRNLELLLDRKHRKEHWRVYAAAMELRRENDFLRSRLAQFIGESAYDIKP